ncbi:hypothetical protein [Bombiscardovia apis]|uniref:hypothetical protein n=1 Tax=Bombiscardovia apis TaxID=2932182 RepID=UPI003CE50122
MEARVLSKLTLNNSQYLFSDLPNWATDSARLNDTADNILRMATIYQTPDSSYYHSSELKSQIVEAWTWFTARAYTVPTRIYGNRWHFEIGIPIDFVKILDFTRDCSNTQQGARLSNYF